MSFRGDVVGTRGVDIEYLENEIRIYPISTKGEIRNTDTYISLPKSKPVLDVFCHYLQSE